MRICILGDAPSIHVRRIATGMVSLGHYVRVVSRKSGSIDGVDVEQFTVPRFSLRYPARWARRRTLALRHLFASHDVVHLNFLHDWFLTPEIVRAGRLIVSPWGSDIVKPPDLDAYPPGIVQIRRSMLHMAHRVLVYGDGFADVVAHFADIDERTIARLPLGVDLNVFRPLAINDNDAPTVGFFKGFKAVYGPSVWIRAIPQVLDRVPGTRFEMIGGGPMRTECQALAESLGVARSITWLAYQPDERMPKIIGRWKLSVIPSLFESFCVAALESSALQVPVVASKVGGLHETVQDGKTGLLVPPGDPQALADGVVQLLRDEPRRLRMGIAGRAMVADQFQWSTTINQLNDIYKEVCADAPGGSSCVLPSRDRKGAGFRRLAAQ